MYQVPSDSGFPQRGHVSRGRRAGRTAVPLRRVRPYTPWPMSSYADTPEGRFDSLGAHTSWTSASDRFGSAPPERVGRIWDTWRL